jgi:hypothetical protein
MAIRFVSDVLLHSPATGTSKLLLVALADLANEDGECWPSNNYLAKVCNISIRQVRTLVHRLVDEGHLDIVDPGGEGPAHTRKLRVKPTSPLLDNKEEVQRTKGEVQRQIRGKPTSPNPIRDPSIDPLEDICPSGTNIYDGVTTSWNAFARLHGLSPIRSLTTKRRQGVRLRHKHIWPVLDEVYRKIAASDFLKGSSGWRIDFDFLWCHPDNYIKILEGKYDNAPRKTDTPTVLMDAPVYR